METGTRYYQIQTHPISTLSPAALPSSSAQRLCLSSREVQAKGIGSSR